jgi:hypothetical protein
MSEENNELLLIKVIYYTKSGIIGEQMLSSEVTLGDIFYNFNTNYKTDFLNIKKIYKYNNIIIKNDDLIKDLIDYSKENQNMIEIKIEIDEKEILDDESDPIIPKIIKPKFYPFSLFVYIPKEGKITLEEYTSNIAKEYHLKKISSGSSYCNSPDSLFISGGGIYYKNPINDFWIINKEDYSIELKRMPGAKRDHSMIYIPNHLILIVGGGDINCYIYDIQRKIFFNWADLNEIRNKPALLNLNNYIYCFSQLTKEKNYFERTNISSKYPKWEKIFPKFQRNVYLYNKKIFCVSKCVNNSILIGAGDNRRQSKLYIYNLLTNEISILKDKAYIEEIDNKIFDKVSKYYNIAIPRYFDREKNIIILNKKKKHMQKIYFSDTVNINKIKLTEEDEIPSDESNLEIKLKNIKNNKLNYQYMEKEKNEENKLNLIKQNLEGVEPEAINRFVSNTNRNNFNVLHTEYFTENDNKNLIEEISEDDEEKYEKKLFNRTLQRKNKPNNYYRTYQTETNYEPDTNNIRIKNKYQNRNINEEINKDLQFGENEKFFNNHNENKEIEIDENEIEDELSGIIKKGDEYDTLDKAVSEKSLLNQIGTEKREMNKTENKRIPKKMNKLPQIKQKNDENKSLLLNNVNYKIENDKEDNYKNNRDFNFNNSKDEDVSIKIE